ncbi:MAG: hypothetical protein CM1200mP22_20970 [Dehalococcoidia bacterium]|nr:MAG: hypothetical protein CM1200mP22_20970 [Dehalococcoidia bacterium]
MAGWEANNHPKAFIKAPENEVVGRLVREIREYKPQVILTFEPGGLYGHPGPHSHIQAHHNSL